MSEAAWLVVERLVPAACVLASVPLLAAAVVAQLLDAEAAWTLFLAGMAAWATGIGWGFLVNRAGPALARG